MAVGTLSLVGTPIGNLGDITFRAVEVLKQVEKIFAEDTRRTKVLLSHLGLSGKRLLSLHAHSSDRSIENALEILLSGESVALVTDAGMPTVSDPGAELVRRAHELHIPVTVVPGPSAVSSAVALSGLVDGPFLFLGFLPRKGRKRSQIFRELSVSAYPVVFFESPHRLFETMQELFEALGDRPATICRELTKKFEEVLATSLKEVSEPTFRQEWIGELTVVLAGGSGAIADAGAPIDIDQRIGEHLARGESPKEVLELVKRELQAQGQRVARRDLYARVLYLRERDHCAPSS